MTNAPMLALNAPINPKSLANWFDALAAARHDRIVACERTAIDSLARDVAPEIADTDAIEEQVFLSSASWVIGRLERIQEIRAIKRSRTAHIAGLDRPAERRAAIIEFAEAIGASRAKLRGDRRAFRDWFEVDAVVDRCDRIIGEAQFAMVVTLGRLELLVTGLAHRGVAGNSLRSDVIAASRQVVERVLNQPIDPRVRSATLAFLERVASVDRCAHGTLAAVFSIRVSRLALNRSEAPIVQEAALSCLTILAPESARTALMRRLEEPGEGDDFWIQRAAVRVAFARFPECETTEIIARLAARSECAAVRQAIALDREAAHPLRDQVIIGLAADDPSLSVRLAALNTCRSMEGSGTEQSIRDLIVQGLVRETAPDALRLLIQMAVDVAFKLARSGQDTAAWAEQVIPVLEDQHVGAELAATRRRAAEAREAIWCAEDPDRLALHDAIAAHLVTVDEGETRRVGAILRRLAPDDATLGRVLSVLAQRDFGLSLERSILGRRRLRRGDRFRRRLWRILHEFRKPGTEKRQAFKHTIGREMTARLTAPSGILSELALTKVPGEPLFIENEQGWRNYLPLLDHVVSAIEQGKTAALFTAEGVTEIVPPHGELRRTIAKLRISLRFSDLAALRNRDDDDYIATLKRLGVAVQFRPHEHTRPDAQVQQYFPAVTLPVLPILPGLDERWNTYIYSIYQNTLGQLAVFLVLAFAWFAGRHMYLSREMRRVRRALPLVIGGWGTRGKSGTERLKAAVFNGLGLALISKTTGCEAMFLHAETFGPTQELFLFRPFDKATIWEQARVARMGRDIGSSVVLWECMGLTPSYVSILQRQWMYDDISTITNTYPDHEDLQGPAGRNIPEVMCEFIPKNSLCLTTEEQMLPILKQGARHAGTELEGVTWLDAAMLPQEALDRFPYDEHPSNIGLVLAMAKTLGLERDRTLREMADCVVPDLGVLKTYPVARIGKRSIEFVNGMSANERFGAMGNWRRTGFAAHDPFEDPGTWLITVVNNRADRVPRSRVFAQILVDDFMADRHVLIGSNLKGLKGFIEEAWQARTEGLSMFRDGEDPAALFEAQARRLRIPHRPEHLEQLARALVAPPGVAADSAPTDPEALAREAEAQGASKEEAAAIRERMQRAKEQVEEAQSIFSELSLGPRGGKADAACRAQLTAWFWEKFVTVEDYYATGDDVVRVLANSAPPNVFTRVMGIQNIKGTGLGFVYAWQDHEEIYGAARKLLSEEMTEAEEGLQILQGSRPIGVLSRDTVLSTLDGIEVSDIDEALAARLAAVREKAAVRSGRDARTVATESSGFASAVWTFIDAFEGVFDVFAAIQRRNRADKVYRHLVAGRISRTAAARTIQELNAQQKGGWLVKRLKSTMRLT